MKIWLKKFWYELTTYITKEQAFMLIIYFAFTAYLTNNKIGNVIGHEETGELKDLKQLREIFKKIPGYDLKVAVNDFEESIAWEIFEKKQPCSRIARNLKRRILYSIRNTEELEALIDSLEEIGGELDGLAFTPKCVNRLVSMMTMKGGISSIADLYGGLSGTGLAVWRNLRKTAVAEDLNLTTEEQRKLYCDISSIRMFCHGIERPDVLRRDLMTEKPDERTYDLVVADLPKRNNDIIYVGEGNEFFGEQEKVSVEWVSIQKILEKLNDGGKAVIVVTKGALVRQGEEKIRERLTQLDWLEAVITLPQNIYSSTHLGFEILILNKDKEEARKGKVFFADLSEYGVQRGHMRKISEEGLLRVVRAYEAMEPDSTFSTVVVTETVISNESSWNPFLYISLQRLQGKLEDSVELGEIAQITRGAQITKEEEILLAENATHYWLNVRNIEHDGIVFEEASRLRAKNKDWESKFGIREDDIILTSKVTVMKVCIVKPEPPKAFLCGNLTRIRVDKEKYSPYVLYEFLRSEDGKTLLESIQTGTTIKVLSNKKLEGMKIPAYKYASESGEKLKRISLEYEAEIKNIKRLYEEEKKEILKGLL